jgi:hypothetical protein
MTSQSVAWGICGDGVVRRLHGDGDAELVGFGGDRRLDGALVGAHDMLAAVDHRLRRVDVAVAARHGVVALALGIVVAGQRVLPAQPVPDVDVERQGEDVVARGVLGQQRIGRRAGRTALAGEQLDDGLRAGVSRQGAHQNGASDDEGGRFQRQRRGW